MNGARIRTPLILALGVLLLSASMAVAQESWEKEVKAEPGQSIELRMRDGGSVEATAWDQDMVRIICTDRHNDLEVYDLEVKETRSGLRFTAESRSQSLRNTALAVELMVPSSFDIDVESGGGSIRIRGVEGEFSGRTGGGEIDLLEVKGRADLKTGGGQIQIEDSELNGRVSTGGGGAQVRDVVGDVKVTSGGGIVSYHNVRGTDGERRGPNGDHSDVGRYDASIGDDTVLYSTAGGGISLDEAPEGAIVSTGGGNIRIRDANRFVQAKTGGGSIEISVRDGHVIANTGAGDIDVEVRDGLGDDGVGVELTTGSGDVTLILPAGISVEFDLDLSYTRNSRQDYEIVSDFDIEEEHTDRWDSSRGSPRKHIYGTATLGEGGPRVRIRCTNGDIYLKKQ
jgi:DUF4097 and DUF4098 domain-containing protein YvlB